MELKILVHAPQIAKCLINYFRKGNEVSMFSINRKSV